MSSRIECLIQAEAFEQDVHAAVSEHEKHLLRGQLTDIARLREFIAAGNATLTFVSKITGHRFTFKFVRPKEEPNQPRPVFVKVLTGPDNEQSYEFIGTIFPRHFGQDLSDYKHSFRKSRIDVNALSVCAVRWLLDKAFGEHSNPELLFARCEVWHEGRCGRCGRKLTVPESIATGFGPECAERIGK